jgi:hypothetical protein
MALAILDNSRLKIFKNRLKMFIKMLTPINH